MSPADVEALCRNGLHPMTEANRVWRGGARGHPECLWCYGERQERKSRPDYCRAGRHRLSGTNAYVAPEGRVRCRACMARNVAEWVRMGLLVQVKCPTPGCRTRTWRSMEAAARLYVCPKHRDQVTLWRSR